MINAIFKMENEEVTEIGIIDSWYMVHSSNLEEMSEISKYMWDMVEDVSKD